MLMKNKNLLKIMLLAFLFALTYLPTFKWMQQRFSAVETYYEHGYLVPFIVGWLVFRKKDKLIKAPSGTHIGGLWLVIAGLLLHVVGLSSEIKFVSGFSMIIVLLGMSLYLLGKAKTKEMLFAIMFIIFMIPIPRVIVLHISFRMKMLAAQAGTYLINLFGITAFRDGSVIRIPGATLTVGSPCSGLRSLIALTALGVLFAYLVDLPRYKKIILFLCSIPLALLANVLRITLIIWVAYLKGEEFATGKFHDYSGIFTFLFAILGLILVSRLLQWKKKK